MKRQVRAFESSIYFLISNNYLKILSLLESNLSELVSFIEVSYNFKLDLKKLPILTPL
mgnify:FL=1